MTNPSQPFRKSTKSGTDACVEVAPDPARPLIRDSKDLAGPVLSVSPQAWRSFLTSLR